MRATELGTVMGAVARRPALWRTSLRQARRLAPRGWWRRPPFLPLPAPGYQSPGQFAYFWILPAQAGTYYFYSNAPAGPNFTTATAVP